MLSIVFIFLRFTFALGLNKKIKIMKKLITTIVFGLIIISANAQIQSLAGPRLGLVYISASPGSSFLNGDDNGAPFDLNEDWDKDAKGALTTLYGWQWETRFADGGDVTGIVEWIALVGGMEKGKFLPSVSSMVGLRTSSGFEFAAGPNVTISTDPIAMVFGLGYNFKSGNLNIPVNIGFIAGRAGTQEGRKSGTAGPDDDWDTDDDTKGYDYIVDYHSGNRFSITVGFNLSK
jgi:hypothetical protein